jgi:hypothetical protein
LRYGEIDKGLFKKTLIIIAGEAGYYWDKKTSPLFYAGQGYD